MLTSINIQPTIKENEMVNNTNEYNHACGPVHDSEFFADIQKVMAKYPHLINKYHITCVDHETDVMKVNFDKTVGVRKIEGNKIITEFRPRSEFATEVESRPCCSWYCPIGSSCQCTSRWI